MTIIDTVFKALAPAIPDRVIAGHHADLMSANIHGINPKRREFFIGGFGPLGGGWGAKRNEDGVSATVCLNDGDTHNAPCEQVETKIPVVVERYALVPDSGGAGRHRGGLGVERRGARAGAGHLQQPDRPRALQAVGPRRRAAMPPATRSRFKRNGAWKTDFPNAKVFLVELKPGDAYRIRSGGGGGYGPPWERPVEKVQRGRAPGLCQLRPGGGALRRGDRSRDPGARQRGDRAASSRHARIGGTVRRAMTVNLRRRAVAFHSRHSGANKSSTAQRRFDSPCSA